MATIDRQPNDPRLTAVATAYRDLVEVYDASPTLSQQSHRHAVLFLAMLDAAAPPVLRVDEGAVDTDILLRFIEDGGTLATRPYPMAPSVKLDIVLRREATFRAALREIVELPIASRGHIDAALFDEALRLARAALADG